MAEGIRVTQIPADDLNEAERILSEAGKDFVHGQVVLIESNLYVAFPSGQQLGLHWDKMEAAAAHHLGVSPESVEGYSLLRSEEFLSPERTAWLAGAIRYDGIFFEKPAGSHEPEG